MQIEIGQSFNNLTVIANGVKDENYHTFYLCRCIRGTQKKVRKDNLGKVTGCGCKRKKSKQYKKRSAIANKKTAKEKIFKKTVSARRKIEDLFLEREMKYDLI